MIEFLIRTRATRDCPGIHPDRSAAVLTPSGWACTPVAGWGDHRVRCGETQIAFSGESIGWQVSFDGPMTQEAAQQFVAAVAHQVEQEIREPAEWIQIS